MIAPDADIVRNPAKEFKCATSKRFTPRDHDARLGRSCRFLSTTKEVTLTLFRAGTVPDFVRKMCREELTLNRFVLALKAFWNILTDADFATRVESLFSKAPSGPDLRILAVLQRDGRLVDFLQEDIDSYSDPQIGAAVRDIHRGCRKSLRDYLTIEPVLAGNEDSPVTVAADFDPAEIRLTGNVQGSPPFRGVLKHHGWRVKSVQLPVLPTSRGESSVIAPAEVEIS